MGGRGDYAESARRPPGGGRRSGGAASVVESAFQRNRADKPSTLVHALRVGSRACCVPLHGGGVVSLAGGEPLDVPCPAGRFMRHGCRRLGEASEGVLVGVQYMWLADQSAILPPQEPDHGHHLLVNVSCPKGSRKGGELCHRSRICSRSAIWEVQWGG